MNTCGRCGGDAIRWTNGIVDGLFCLDCYESEKKCYCRRKF